MIRTVTGNDSRSDKERIIIGINSERSIWTCSGCVDITLPWFDRIASISSRIDVDGIDENRIKVGFSPVTSRLRSLNTFLELVKSSGSQLFAYLVSIVSSRPDCDQATICSHFCGRWNFQGSFLNTKLT